MTYKPMIFAVAGLLLAAAGAHAQQMAPMNMAAPASPADRAMMAGMDKMSHDMAAAPMTGDADHDFVAMMLPHHQGAVAMAKVELQYGKNPEMRRMARDIVASQDQEIAEMKTWLAKHPK
jgi:uncharacterized protein (DUF305 family)